MRGLALFATFCLWSVLALNLEARHSDEEKREEDLTFLAEADDEVLPISFYTHRRYQTPWLKERTHAFSFDDIVHHMLADGFSFQNAFQDLVRARLDIEVAFGRLLPGLNLHIGNGLSISLVAGIFGGLTQFIRPDAWLFLAGKKRASKVAGFVMQKTLLDQILAAKTAYYNQLELLSDLEIVSFYLNLANEWAEKSTVGNEGNMNLPILALRSEITSRLGKINQGFNDIAYLMALDHLGSDITVRSLNIQDASDISWKIVEPAYLERPYNNKADFINEVIRQSVELGAVQELDEMSKLNIGIAAVGGNFVLGESKGQLLGSLRLGYDTIPQILIAKSNITTANLKVKEQYIKLIDTARRAFDLWEDSYHAYVEARRNVIEARRAWKDLVALLGQEVEVHQVNSFFTSLRQLIQAEQSLNKALYSHCRAKALLDRYLVPENTYVNRYLPRSEDIATLLEEIHFHKKSESKSQKLLGGLLKQVKKTDQLRHILYHHKEDSALAELPQEAIIRAVRENMPQLLATSFWFRKSSRFFRALKHFVHENKIDLTQEERQTLSTKIGFEAWEQKLPSLAEIKAKVGALAVPEVLLTAGMESGAVMIFKSEVKSCGFAIDGSRCIDSAFKKSEGLFAYSYLEEVDSLFIVAPLIYNSEGKTAVLALATVVDKVSTPDVAIRAADVYQVDGAFNGDKVFRHIMNGSLVKVAQIQEILAQNDALCHWIGRLHHKDLDARSLYQLVAASVALDRNQVYFSALLQILWDNYEQVIKLSDSKYQKLFLSLVEKHFADPSDLLRHMALDQLASDNKDVAKGAAIVLAKKKIVSLEVASQLQQALASHDFVIREQVIPAMAMILNNAALNEETKASMRKQIILSLGDDEESVRQAAQGAVARLKMDDEDLPALKEALSISQWPERVCLYKLIAGINTKASQSQFLLGITDSESHIRDFVIERVIALGMNESQIEVLIGIARSEASLDITQEQVVSLLAGMDTPKALQLLDSLASNRALEVRLAALQVLAKLDRFDSLISLMQHAFDQEGEVRRFVHIAIATRIGASDLALLESSFPENSTVGSRANIEAAIRSRLAFYFASQGEAGHLALSWMRDNDPAIKVRHSAMLGLPPTNL